MNSNLFCRVARSALTMLLVASSQGEEAPVSFFKQVVPIFKESCNGCHHPGKMKGDLDLTTHAAILKGGKHGSVIKPGDPSGSTLVEEISGKEPSMPQEGDPLTAEQVGLIERWISQGALDDTPAEKRNPYKLAGSPTYPSPALISSARYSPDGNLVAVTGYHEVILYKSDGTERVC